MPAEAPRVFISYSHDSPAHCDEVLAFADRLRADGIDAWIDQYIQSPPIGWPEWCEEQIRDADFVLMVCTETYLRRVERKEPPGIGHGATSEANLIRNMFMRTGTVNRKFVPVLLAGGSSEHVPTRVRGAAIHRVEIEAGYEQLYRLPD